MTTANLVLDALLAKGAYRSNNVSTTPAVNGSAPIAVGWDAAYVDRVPATFGAQLYKNADGTFTIAFRGTEANFGFSGNNVLRSYT